MRFSKRFTLMPGVRLNLGMSGLTLGVGPRGASVSLGSRGTYLNAGIPGSGFSSRQRIDGPAPRPRGHAAKQQKADELQYLVNTPPKLDIPISGGDVGLLDGRSGLPLEPRLAAHMWKLGGEDLLGQIRQVCERANQVIDALGLVHESTPSPLARVVWVEQPFDELAPEPPVPQSYSWFWKLFQSHRDKIDALNAAEQQQYLVEHDEWDKRRASHKAAQHHKRRVFDYRESLDPEKLGQYLEDVLQQIEWPRQTHVALAVEEDGSVTLDVDLPEIEDMPTGYPEPIRKGRAIRYRALTDSARRQLYVAHVHGVIFKLIGLIFQRAPNVPNVTAAGYSQRANAGTGHVGNEYLISVQVPRMSPSGGWLGINFSALNQIDPVEALGRFDCRRTLSKTGVFKPIVPHVTEN